MRRGSVSKASQKQIIDEDHIAEAQTELLRKPKFSDITVICRDRSWKCQRSILSQRCDFFGAACSGSFLESRTATIRLNDDDPLAVDVMLLYLYTLQKPDFSDNKLFSQGCACVQRVYKIADKYSIPRLRDHAKEYFLMRINNHLATWHNIQDLSTKSSWMQKIRFFWDSDTADSSEIRTALIEALVKTSKSIIEYDQFQKLLGSYQDLNIALIRQLAIKAKGK